MFGQHFNQHHPMRNLQFILITLSIILVSCDQPQKVAFNKDAKGGFFKTDEAGVKYKSLFDTTTYKLNPANSIGFSTIEKITRKRTDGFDVINIVFNDEGKLAFKKMSEENVGKPICIVVNDKILVAATMMEAITDGIISLQLSNEKEVNEILKMIRK
jgi:preprotein translocase subunit SecD